MARHSFLLVCLISALSLSYDLYLLTIVEGAKGYKNAHSASKAENEIPVHHFLSSLTMGEGKIAV
jgi:hypothetical protein